MLCTLKQKRTPIGRLMSWNMQKSRERSRVITTSAWWVQVSQDIQDVWQLTISKIFECVTDIHADLDGTYNPLFYSPSTSYQYDQSLANELSRVSPTLYGWTCIHASWLAHEARVFWRVSWWLRGCARLWIGGMWHLEWCGGCGFVDWFLEGNTCEINLSLFFKSLWCSRSDQANQHSHWSQWNIHEGFPSCGVTYQLRCAIILNSLNASGILYPVGLPQFKCLYRLPHLQSTPVHELKCAFTGASHIALCGTPIAARMRAVNE